VARQPDPRGVLSALADALNACEDAGLKPKLKHGPLIITTAGFVLPPLDGGRWTAAFPSQTEPEGTPDEDPDD
jgi:hypothetical protein